MSSPFFMFIFMSRFYAKKFKLKTGSRSNSIGPRNQALMERSSAEACRSRVRACFSS